MPSLRSSPLILTSQAKDEFAKRRIDRGTPLPPASPRLLPLLELAAPAGRPTTAPGEGIGSPLRGRPGRRPGRGSASPAGQGSAADAGGRRSPAPVHRRPPGPTDEAARTRGDTTGARARAQSDSHPWRQRRRPAARSNMCTPQADRVSLPHTYALRDVDGRAVSLAEAKRIVAERYTIPPELRRARLTNTTGRQRWTGRRSRESQSAPSAGPSTTNATVAAGG